MATLTVGATGQQFTTLSAAVAASHAGDTIQVQAGTYLNDWAEIDHALTIVGVGGYAHFTSDQDIPNGKGTLVVNANVTVQNLEFSNARVGDLNGAGIRWESGNLTVLNSYFHDNQEGILAGTNPTGIGIIKNSAFIHNGNDPGDDQEHGVYIGQVASLLVDGNYFSNQNGGQHLKSRAATTTIINNYFVDPVDGTTNYVIDLPNGGNAVVQNNYIQQSGTPGNKHIIHFGGEVADPQGSLLVSGNTIASYYDDATAVLNQSQRLATITNNQFFHIGTVESTGPASISGNTTLGGQPTAPTWTGWLGGNPPPPPAPPVFVPPPPAPPGAIHGTGWVYGTSGNDYINGDGGHDSLVGNGGNDTFAGGKHVEAGAGGLVYVGESLAFISAPDGNTIQVSSAVNFSLFTGSYNNVTRLTLTGTSNINGTGTWGNDALVGNAGNNLLTGNGGNDTFTGGAGNDTIAASAGSTSTAIYTDTFASHSFSGSAAMLTVGGSDGTDVLQNITTLKFSDRTITVAQALAGASPPPPPPPVSPPPPPPPPVSPPPPPPASGIHGTGWVYGTSGNDSITGDSGNDSLVGQGGSDTFVGGRYVQGTGGTDVIYVSNAATFIDEPNANNAQVMSSVSYSLYDGSWNNVLKLTLTGSANINATGTWGNNTLVGNAGNNLLTGNGGNDTFTGGAGNDTIVAAAGSSSTAVYTDTYASHSFTGTASNLTVGGGGTDLLQNITTLVFSDRTITTAQALAGVSPPPPPPPVSPPPPPPPVSPPPPPPSATIHGTGWVYGTSGNNSIVGDSGSDSLVGKGGNDTFSGGTYVEGLGGSDLIYVTKAGTFINEPNANAASVMSSVTFSLYDGSYNNVHKLTLTGSANINGTGTWTADTLVGNSGNNKLVGNGGNDTFTGGAGNDTIIAAAGSSSMAIYTDTYASHSFSGSAANLTVGGGGSDLLQNITTLKFSDMTITTAQALAGVSPPPPPPPPPPVTTTTKHGTGWVYGTTGNDSIVGDSGHDSLVGKGGNDTFSGGTYVEGSGGNDVIYVTNSATFINEPNPNNAQVMSSVSFSLFDGSYNNVHKLTLTGAGNLTATGTWGSDVLTGNAGNSTLNGLSGADTMVGGSGHDMFRFDTLASQNSVVKGFTHGQDVIDLHGVLAQVGSSGDPIANHTLTLSQSGADTKVLIDDHTGTPKLLVTLQGVTASTLNAQDFHY